MPSLWRHELSQEHIKRAYRKLCSERDRLTGLIASLEGKPFLQEILGPRLVDILDLLSAWPGHPPADPELRERYLREAPAWESPETRAQYQDPSEGVRTDLPQKGVTTPQISEKNPAKGVRADHAIDLSDLETEEGEAV